MSVVVAKLRHSFMGIFIRSKMIVNKKRPPWQEVVFNVTNNLGKLSPQGGDLVQLSIVIATEHFRLEIV